MSNSTATVIVRMDFGSHLYGTATPDSDRDYKGIYLPSLRELALNRVPKTITSNTNTNPNQKNSPDDVDLEYYSLHYFLDLALRGETVALDMLHAPRSAILETNSIIWSSLVANRERFYTKNLRSLVGYARRQAAKYGVKGSRLSDAREVLQIMEEALHTTEDTYPETRIGDLSLPELEHAKWLPADEKTGIRSYQVCGKMFQETARVHSYIDTMRRFVANYGHRAKMAEKNEGIDWKAISHAFRAGYQTYYILTQRGFTYPLPETEYLIKVKTGQVRFQEAAEALEELIARVEEISANSPLPVHPDRAWWDRWLEGVVTVEMLDELGERLAESDRLWKEVR